MGFHIKRNRTEARRVAAEHALRQLDRLLSYEDKRAIRRNEAELYGDDGLPV